METRLVIPLADYLAGVFELGWKGEGDDGEIRERGGGHKSIKSYLHVSHRFSPGAIYRTAHFHTTTPGLIFTLDSKGLYYPYSSGGVSRLPPTADVFLSLAA